MEDAFLSNEQMTVDEKGRVGIPARYIAVLKARCPEETDKVGLMITPERSIKVMPINAFHQEVNEWKTLDERDEDERTVLNMTGLAEEAPLDKQNRIKLNPMMMDLCGIARQVVFVGSVNYMQIYDAAVWREMVLQNLGRFSQVSTQLARRAKPRVVPTDGDSGGGQ